MNMKKFFAIFLAAMMIFSLAACSGGSNEPAAPADGDTPEGELPEGTVQIRIGATGPLTGGAAIYGQAVKNGARSQSKKSTPWAASSSSSRWKTTPTTPKRPRTLTTRWSTGAWT